MFVCVHARVRIRELLGVHVYLCASVCVCERGL